MRRNRRTRWPRQTVLRYSLRIGLGVLALGLVGLLYAYRTSATRQFARHLQRGDQYYEHGQLREAVIEYRNLLRIPVARDRSIDQTRAQVIGRLARAQYEVAPSAALGSLALARDVLPEDLDLRAKLSRALLRKGARANAREEARFVLDRDPGSVAALLVLAECASTDDQLLEAIDCLEEARTRAKQPGVIEVALAGLYLARDQIDLAETSLDRARQTQSDSAELHLLAARIHLRRGLLEDARRALALAGEIEPDAPGLGFEWARYYETAGDSQEAARQLRKIPESAADYPRALAALARIAFERGENSECEKLTSSLLRLDPGDPNALLLRAELHLATGDTAQALSELRSLTRRFSGFAVAEYEMARALALSGDERSALERVGRALAIAPKLDRARLLRSQLRLGAADAAPAIADSAGQATATVDRPTAAMEKRAAAARADRAESALADIDQVLARNPGDAGALELASKAYVLAGRFDRAEDSIRAWIQVEPERADARRALAIVLLARSRTPEASSAFEDALRLAPEDGDSLRLLASLERLHGRPEAAIRRIQEQQERAPSSMAIRLVLAREYREQQQIEPAIASYRLIIAASPKLTEASLELADLLAARKRPEEALATLQALLEVVPEAPMALLQVGILQEQLGHGEQAQATFARFAELHLDPRDWRGRLEQGKIQLRTGQTAAAVASFEGAVELAPDVVDAYHYLGQAHAQAKEFDQAKAALRRALRIAPQLDATALLLGEVELRSGSPEKAIPELERVVSHHPAHQQAHYLLGWAYRSVGKTDQAIAEFRRTVELAPESWGARTDLASVLVERDPAAARVQLEAALRAAPAEVEPLRLLVGLELRAKRPDAALACALRQIAAIGPSASHQLLLANLYRLRKEADKARTALDVAAGIEPRRADAHIELARLWSAEGRFELALGELDKALLLEPDSGRAFEVQGQIEMNSGDAAAARISWERALELRPDAYLLANNLALLLAQDQELGQAAELASRAHKLAPGNREITDTLGWILYQQGRYYDARTLLATAAAGSDAPERLFHLGMACFQLGEREVARTSLRAALDAKATFADAAEARTTLAKLEGAGSAPPR